MRASICKAHNYLPHNLERQVLLPFVYNSPLLPAFAKAALDLGYLMPEHVFNHYSTQDAGGWGNGGGVCSRWGHAKGCEASILPPRSATPSQDHSSQEENRKGCFAKVSPAQIVGLIQGSSNAWMWFLVLFPSQATVYSFWPLRLWETQRSHCHPFILGVYFSSPSSGSRRGGITCQAPSVWFLGFLPWPSLPWVSGGSCRSDDIWALLTLLPSVCTHHLPANFLLTGGWGNKALALQSLHGGVSRPAPCVSAD